MTARGDKRWMVLIWVVALAVQILYLSEGGRDPSFFEPVIDAAMYDKLARSIASGELLPDGAFWQPPLYQYFLGGIYFLFGPHILAAKIIQALIGATSCLLTFLIGKRLFSRSVGVISGLIMAFYGPMIFFNGQLLSTGPEVFLDLLALRLFLAATDKPRTSRWFACGLVTGAAAVARPTILVILAEAVVVLIIIAIRRKSLGGWAADTFSLVLGAALAIAPATACNYLVERRPVLICTNGGVNLFIGNNPHAEETIAIRPGIDWKNLLDQGWTTGAPTRIELDQYFFSEAKSFFLERPGDAASNLLRKARLFWSSYETPRNVDIYVFTKYSRLLSLLVWRQGSFSFPFGVLAPLAFLGIITGCKGYRGKVMLVVFVLLYSLAVIAFFNAARYRLPLVPVLSIFAAAGIIWLLRQVRIRRYLRAAAAALASIAVGILVNLPVRAPSDGVNFHAELYNFLGMRDLHTHNDPAGAEEEFRRSLRIDPGYAVVHGRLGSVLAEQGKVNEAIEECRRAVQLAPILYEPHYTLANLLAASGRGDEAIEYYTRTIELKPDHAEAHNNLASLLVKKGRMEEALEHFRRSLFLKPDAPEGVYFNLVLLLKKRGSYAEATRVLRAGILNHQESAALRANLAWVLATCPDDTLRNGVAAVTLAESACIATGHSNPDLLDMLAAANAETGRYDEAVETGRRAAELAKSLGNMDLAIQIEKRVKLYKKRRPYRDGGKDPMFNDQ